MRALAAHDAETEGHSRRVAELSVALGRLLGLNDVELAMLGRGALLHDIGKIGVPDAILRKPGPLTEEEWRVMRGHPLLGGQILRELPFLRQAALIVLQHHERYDGRGYPRGLRGEEIVFGARIVSAVDAFDAMTSWRPYRLPLSPVIALEEIVHHRGRQFDPTVVDALRALGDDLYCFVEKSTDYAARAG